MIPVNHVIDPSDAEDSGSTGSAPIYSTRTESRGTYRIDPLPTGEYNVLGDLEGSVSFQDSVFLSEQTGFLSDDTLAPPGILRGTIGILPNHDILSAAVQVIGADISANLPDYRPLLVPVHVRSGEEDFLETPLFPAYSGIPVVTGLKAKYDTVRGIVELTWNPADYRDISDYLVFRDSGQASDLAPESIGRSIDVVFLDTLYLPSRTGLFLPRTAWII